MRIAQVAPLVETVPPEGYGGTERIVSYLTEELVRLGHDVTLFASGGSTTAAKLVPISARALRSDPSVQDPLSRIVLEIEEVLKRSQHFDLVHFHDGYIHFPLARRLGIPAVTTMHGRMDLLDLASVFQEFSDMPLVSISDQQRTPLHSANWIATVYHGLPEDLYSFRADPEDYVAFVGRICPEKRADRAIEIAKKAGVPLKIAAKVDKADEQYFESKIKPLLDDSLVEFIGEINEQEKNVLFGGARAFLFPIDWPEPFGLVMIESLACGTPVIAFEHGSVPEILEHERTGFIVHDVPEAVEALKKIERIDRHVCRQEFEARFTVRQMVRKYVSVYEQLRTESSPQLLESSTHVAALAGKATFDLEAGCLPSA
ncbi:MAG: glycosyltransferase family 4 protein [Acidobacteriaceae bacterium]|nr:glycosyltransferase family 4 protein [Acidobacteriaceae bacterium]